MIIRSNLIAFLSLAISVSLFEFQISAAEDRFDEAGALRRLQLGSGWLELQANVRVPATGWGKIFSIDKTKATFIESGGRKNWQGRLGDSEKVDIELTQTVTAAAHGSRFDFIASAVKESAVEGVIFHIDLPADVFANGSLETTGKDEALGVLSAQPVENIILSSGTIESARIFNRDKSICVEVKFDAPTNCTIQDSRKWGPYFSLLIYIHSGVMLKNQTARFGLTLSATGQPDLTPAEFKVDANAVRYELRGLGGNYCFNLESPERDYTLQQLKPQFARTEISLNDWMPHSGELPAAKAGKLPREFEMMRELARSKIPFIASVWTVPGWMTQTAGYDDKPEAIKLAPELRGAAAAAIVSYLLYAKSEFSAEPQYVSFNEPDYGANIKFTAEEHREMIKLLGAELKKSGLKTKVLLGDVSNARVSFDFLRPALNDPDAMQNVGALSFHSWGGATPEQYAAWSDLAVSLKIPLIVAEAGVDPGAWKDKSFKSFDYAVREMAHYQNLLQYARPQAILYWEYTSDYSLLAADAKKPGVDAEPERFVLQRHWLNFIPPGSMGLETTGMHAQVQLTAFKLPGNAPVYTFNLSNTAWTRTARLTGIPAGVQALNVIQTARGVLLKSLPPIVPVDGTIEIELPGESLTTLTTLK